MTLLAQAADEPSLFGWHLGLTIGLVVVVVVVALVTPILLLARRIGRQAAAVDEALRRAEGHTAALGGLRETIDSAAAIVGGLQRARSRLGG